MSKKISDHAHAAKLIRAELKVRGIKARVRSDSYSMGSSVNVDIEDGISPKAYASLSEFANKFQYGHFNGSEDIYEYSNSREDIPQVKFVFVNNRPSDSLKAEIKAFAENYYGPYKAAAEYEKNEIEWRLFSGALPIFWEKREAKAEAEFVPHAEGI